MVLNIRSFCIKMAIRFPLDDQHILEEDYDENYEPTEEGKLERISDVKR